MPGLDLILLLLAAAVALRLVAQRFGIPYPSVLVVGGLAIAFVPGLPRVQLSPDVLFLIFVPPLLFWGAAAFPLRDLRRESGSIIRLAVVLVVVSTFAVALVARSLHPSFTWAAALTLGAIVAPPDPVVVLSALRSLRLSRPIEAILEGEGLLNDAVALIAYRVAVAAAVTGVFSAYGTGIRFVAGAVGGIAIGLAVGWLVLQAHRVTRSLPAVSNTVSLLAPFAAFLPAEHLGASGVLAVVAAAMFMARTVSGVLGPETRVQIRTTWNVVTFILESLVFILVGLELPYVMRALDRFSITFLIREAAAVSLCLIVVRIVWVMPTAYLFRGLGRRLRGRDVEMPNWRVVLFVAWAGLRGGDSLVLALALPLTTMSGSRFPARDQIVFITFFVIFISLVIQGPTLAPFARWLRVFRDTEDEREEAHARLVAAEAGLKTLDEPELANSAYPEVVRYVRQRQRRRARRWAAHEAQYRVAGDDEHDHSTAAPSPDAVALDKARAEEYRRIRSVMLDAEHRAVLELRDRDAIADDVMRRVQRDLDLEQILLGGPEPVAEPVREVASSIDAPSRQ